MYTYKKPQGTRVSITRKQHNMIFPRSYISFFRSFIIRYDYYVDESGIWLERFIRVIPKIFITLISPMYIIMAGLPVIYKEIKSMWFQKRYGSFVGDYVWNTSETYVRFVKVVNMEHLIAKEKDEI